MNTPGIIVISVGEELSEHLLNVVQGFLLGLGGLLLSFQSSTKVIITVIGHMHRHSARSHRVDCCQRGIPTVTPRSRGYDDVTAMYIRRSEILLHIYAKHQYR